LAAGLVGLALNVRFNTIGICAKNNTHIYPTRCEQAIKERSRWVIFIAACCYSVKLCALDARAFRS